MLGPTNFTTMFWIIVNHSKKFFFVDCEPKTPRKHGHVNTHTCGHKHPRSQLVPVYLVLDVSRMLMIHAPRVAPSGEDGSDGDDNDDDEEDDNDDKGPHWDKLGLRRNE